MILGETISNLAALALFYAEGEFQMYKTYKEIPNEEQNISLRNLD